MSPINTDSIVDELKDFNPNGFAIGLNFENGAPTSLKSTYSGDWANTYLSENLLGEDPTIQFGQQHLGATSWSDIRKRFSSTRTLDIASDFGMTQGNTLSVVINGRKTIASFAGKKWTEAEKLRAFGLVGALAAFNFTLPPSPAKARDIYALSLVAKGYKETEIAEIVGLSADGVRRQIKRAKIALGAQTTASATAKATGQGWI